MALASYLKLFYGIGVLSALSCCNCSHIAKYALHSGTVSGTQARSCCVQKGFAAAQQLPVHPSRPEMKAVKVLPGEAQQQLLRDISCIPACMGTRLSDHATDLNAVLPDFERWSNKYVVVTFDDNPVREFAPLASADSGRQKRAAGDACAKLVCQSGMSCSRAGQVALHTWLRPC